MKRTIGLALLALTLSASTLALAGDSQKCDSACAAACPSTCPAGSCPLCGSGN